MRLGQFTQDTDGNFHGTLRAYGLPETSVMLTPQTSQNGKPYYEITADPVKGAFDGGAAFPKQKGDLDYLSVTLDSPMFLRGYDAMTKPPVAPLPEKPVIQSDAPKPTDPKHHRSRANLDAALAANTVKPAALADGQQKQSTPVMPPVSRGQEFRP